MKENQNLSQLLIYSEAVILSVKSLSAVEKTMIPVTVTIRLGGGGIKV